MIDCNTCFCEFVVGCVGLCVIFLWTLVKETKSYCERSRFRGRSYDICVVNWRSQNLEKTESILTVISEVCFVGDGEIAVQ